MNEKLLKASDYGDRENKAVFQVLIELAQILGSQHGNFVIVGGSVPSLLFDKAIFNKSDISCNDCICICEK